METLWLVCVQAVWLQLTDTAAAGVVAAELAFLRAQLAELPALEQLDAAQGARAGPGAPDPPEAAEAPQHRPAEAHGAGSLSGGTGGASSFTSRAVGEPGCVSQTRAQSMCGAGTRMDASQGRAGQPGALAEGVRVLGNPQGAPAAAPPAATRSQGARHADDSCASREGVSDGGAGMAVSLRT